jgi:hypothetical protein
MDGQENPNGETNDASTSPSIIQVELKKLELEKAKVENWGTVIDQIIPKVVSYFEQRMVKHEAPIAKTGLWLLGGLAFVITIGTGVLVYVGKLDAASFTFVVGTVLGFMLSFTRLFWKQDGGKRIRRAV